MLKILGLFKAYKNKWRQYQEVQALTEFSMLVKTGTTESDAKAKINHYRRKQFDWEKLLSSEFAQAAKTEQTHSNKK